MSTSEAPATDIDELSAAQSVDRDSQRLQSLRERNSSRRDRFINARVRSIGVDVKSLEEQIAQKRALKDAEIEATNSDSNL